jgi:hypothetical protein
MTNPGGNSDIMAIINKYWKVITLSQTIYFEKSMMMNDTILIVKKREERVLSVEQHLSLPIVLCFLFSVLQC